MTENERLAKVEVQLDQNTKEIDELKSDNKVIYDIATSVKVMATEMQGMSQQMSEMKDDISDVKKQVNEVENKPAKITADTVNKVKVSIYTVIATTISTGILGSIIFFIGK